MKTLWLKRWIVQCRISHAESKADRMRRDIDSTPPQLRAIVCGSEPARLRALDRELSIMRCELAALQPPLRTNNHG